MGPWCFLYITRLRPCFALGLASVRQPFSRRVCVPCILSLNFLLERKNIVSAMGKKLQDKVDMKNEGLTVRGALQYGIAMISLPLMYVKNC